MSIKFMSLIWDAGPEAQSDRFVMLALADFSNDQGECWPSIEGIRKKTCMSERGVQAVLRRLRDAGWVEIFPGGGRKNCNLYRLKTPQQMHPAAAAPPQMSAETPQMSAKNPAADAPEPSRTIKEPSLEDTDVSLSADAAAPVHASEASEAVSAYNAAAEQAGWPKVQRMSPARTRALKARLRECGGIEGWQHALKRAIDSDFLCGRTSKAWAGFSFDWMTKAANFTKLMEGNYDNRDRQPATAESDPTLRAIARAAGAF